MTTKAEQLYDFLNAVAARTDKPVLYDHAGAAIDMPRHRLTAVLLAVAQRCREAGEPDLTSLVVKASTGEVAAGYTGDPADAANERRRCHEFYGARRFKGGAVA